MLLMLLLLQGAVNAEERYWYPEGRWSWRDPNVAYVLKEYDKNAARPGCIEWLSKTGYEGKGGHNLPGYFVFISAAGDAKWDYSMDSTKPEAGSIVYWDIHANTPEYKYAMALVRKVDAGQLTLEYWSRKENKVIQYTRNIENMRVTPSGLIFRGYIYPVKMKK